MTFRTSYDLSGVEKFGSPDFFALQRESEPHVAYAMQETGLDPDTAYDHSGNNRHGNINIGVTANAGRLGKIPRSFLFNNNVNHWIIRNNEGWMNEATNQITIEAVASASGFSGYPHISGMDDASSQRKFFIRFQDSSNFSWCVTTTGGLTAVNYPFLMLINNPYHIVGTYDGSFMRMYINGELVNSTAKTGNLATPSLPLYVGRSNYIGYPMQGRIAGFAWYPSALSASRIAEHARAAGLKS